MYECFQIQATTPSIVALPQKNEPQLFVNGADISDGKPVTISKIEVIENKSVTPELPEPSTADDKKPEPVSTPNKTEEQPKISVDKDSFIVTPDYIQQSMFFQINLNADCRITQLMVSFQYLFSH